MRVKVCQPTNGLTSTCRQTEIKDNPASIGETYGQHVDSPAVDGFLYRNSALNQQLLQDAVLTPIPYTNKKSSPTVDGTSATSHSSS